MRQAVVYQDEDGAWIVEVPSLPGCICQGTTKDEALKNIGEAMELWIDTAGEHGQEVPPDRGSLEVTELVDPAE